MLKPRTEGHRRCKSNDWGLGMVSGFVRVSFPPSPSCFSPGLLSFQPGGGSGARCGAGHSSACGSRSDRENLRPSPVRDERQMAFLLASRRDACVSSDTHMQRQLQCISKCF